MSMTEVMERALESAYEAQLEKRSKWLEENGYEEKDVMQDEEGEYILVESDNGNPGEDGYDVTTKKFYLNDLYTNSNSIS